MPTPLTYTLSLTDGPTTLDLTPWLLNDGGYQMVDGGDAPTVTESVKLAIQEPIASARHKLQSIRKMLGKAMRFQAMKIGPQVYAQYVDYSGAETWRSEIVGGRAQEDPRTLDLHWKNDLLVFTLAWERLNFWEAPEAEVYKLNGNEAVPGTPATGALNIFNNNDGTGATPNIRRDYVHLAADAIRGDLPAACRIEFINTTAGTPRNRHLYISHSLLPDPANLVHMLEGEAGGASTGEAGNSGAAYSRHALLTSETTAYTWALTTAQLNAFGGNCFAVFARFRALVPSSTKLRLKLNWQATTFWQADSQVTPNTTDYLQQIGTIYLPPAILGNDHADLDLVLTATRASAANLDLDYLLFLPLDGFRKPEAKIAYGLEQNATLVVDGISRPSRIYTLHTAERVPDYSNRTDGTPPILLYPGEVQRLIFAWDAADGTALPARTATVRMYYRPKRATI